MNKFFKVKGYAFYYEVGEPFEKLLGGKLVEARPWRAFFDHDGSVSPWKEAGFFADSRFEELPYEAVAYKKLTGHWPEDAE